MKNKITALIPISLLVYIASTIYLTSNEEELNRYLYLGDGLAKIYEGESDFVETTNWIIEKTCKTPPVGVDPKTFKELCINFHMSSLSLYQDDKWRRVYLNSLAKEGSRILITPYVYLSTMDERWMYDRYKEVVMPDAKAFYALYAM